MSPIRIEECNCKLIIEFLIGEQVKKSCGLRHFVNGASLTSGANKQVPKGSSANSLVPKSSGADRNSAETQDNQFCS